MNTIHLFAEIGKTIEGKFASIQVNYKFRRHSAPCLWILARQWEISSKKRYKILVFKIFHQKIIFVAKYFWIEEVNNFLPERLFFPTRFLPVTERVLSFNEKPWEIMKQLGRDSIRQMELMRFYLQLKKDPHGPNLALFVGNLPPNLSERNYENILTELLGKGMREQK